MKASHRSIDVHDHLSSGLVALAVVSSFLFLLQHTVPGCSVLKGKLAENLTEPVDADLPHAVGWMAEEQQERMEPGKNNMDCHDFFCTFSPIVPITHTPVNNPTVDDL